MTFPGKIIRHLAQNSDLGLINQGYYEVECYKEGLLGPISIHTVRQLQFADGESIPEGTWALICRSGHDYYMQVPVYV